MPETAGKQVGGHSPPLDRDTRPTHVPGVTTDPGPSPAVRVKGGAGDFTPVTRRKPGLGVRCTRSRLGGDRVEVEPWRETSGEGRTGAGCPSTRIGVTSPRVSFRGSR